VTGTLFTDPGGKLGGLVEDRTFPGLDKKPKSQKGWQKWRRKYALALLSDQIDRITHFASKKTRVMSILTKWEEGFRAECSRHMPSEHVYNTHDIVEDQIDFVTEYVACAICDGTGKDSLNRIRHFLSMQGAQNIGERIELRFVGGSPIEAYAYVDSLKDIDIADVFSIVNFDSMTAYREKMRKWNRRTARTFLNDVKKDVLFDMPNTVFTVDPDRAAGLTEFEISFEVNESDLNLKMLQCMPPAFLQRFSTGRKRL
jgi:hypothetical protein